ncbi:MAG: tetratricopeptide repeat protein [Deltaproteobacteria bacterium]|nr:tetratricopeptide repeat protein [Deltaproteobacteria bacterium]
MVPFFVNARYRLPIMPIALALAAVTMTAVAHRLWRGVREERRRAWATVAAFAAVWMVSHAVFRGPLAVQTGTASEERHRGMALYRDGRFEEAVAAYRRSLGEKESSITRNNLANALKQLGRFDEARAEYENALRLNPQSAVAWYNVGNFRFEVEKDADGAREAYEHATRFAPEMAAAQYKLGTVLASLGRSADARWAFERCVAAAKPDDPLIPLARRALQQLP